MLTEDFACLSRLNNVVGVPTLCAQLAGLLALQPVGQKFDCKMIKNHGLAHSRGQLIDILKEAHSRALVNRDIQMENIMIAGSIATTNYRFTSHEQHVGPFHKNSFEIVGPNGSGVKAT